MAHLKYFKTMELRFTLCAIFVINSFDVGEGALLDGKSNAKLHNLVFFDIPIQSLIPELSLDFTIAAELYFRDPHPINAFSEQLGTI